MELDPLIGGQRPFEVNGENDNLLFNYATGKLDSATTTEVKNLIESSEFWNEYYLDMKCIYDTYGENGLQIIQDLVDEIEKVVVVNLDKLKALQKEKSLYELAGEFFSFILLVTASVYLYYLFTLDSYVNATLGEKYLPLIFVSICILGAGWSIKSIVIPSFTLRKKLKRIILLFLYRGNNLPEKEYARMKKILLNPKFYSESKYIRTLIKQHGENAANVYLENLKR